MLYKNQVYEHISLIYRCIQITCLHILQINVRGVEKCRSVLMSFQIKKLKFLRIADAVLTF